MKTQDNSNYWVSVNHYRHGVSESMMILNQVNFESKILHGDEFNKKFPVFYAYLYGIQTMSMSSN